MKFKQLLFIAYLVLGCNQLFSVDFKELLEKTKHGNAPVNEFQLEEKLTVFIEKYKDNAIHYYQDADFEESGVEIDIEKSLSLDDYQDDFQLADDEVILPRLKSAITFKQNENIDRFTEVVKDIIKRYPLNKHTAQAAHLLGSFENTIFNVDEAIKLFLFVVNVHFNSPVGPDSYLELAVALEKKDYHIQSEEVIFHILALPSANDLHLKSMNYLYEKLIARMLWFWKEKNFNAVQYYLEKIKQLRSLELFDSFRGLSPEERTSLKLS